MPAGALNELIPVLQMAVGPVILISAVGLLLLTLSNRFGRVIDRSRILCREIRQASGAERDRAAAQVKILLRRAVFIRRSIILAAVSALLSALLVITIFLLALLDGDIAGLIALLFTGALAALVGSLVELLRDINLSLEALKLELGTDAAPAPSAG
ncbi:MAG: DUF2721 domain-containing protein [Planctomycetota bacterium]